MFKDKLYRRHQIIKKIRCFLDDRGLIEVQTPVLLNTPATDTFIDSVASVINYNGVNKTVYLHTSPELAMKKLLSQGSGDIYQICTVFRNNEAGERNFNEFTLLEYYRLGFDMQKLMDDVVCLLSRLNINGKVYKISYSDIFFKYTDIDILNTNFMELKQIAVKYGLTADFKNIEDLQMLLFAHFIEPRLTQLPLCFIYDYPLSQSLLAKVQGMVAKRFELYINGIEVANGYYELQNAMEYKKRFVRDMSKRTALSKDVFAIDEDFLASLKNPLPECAGVAIGVERLLSVLGV